MSCQNDNKSTHAVHNLGYHVLDHSFFLSPLSLLVGLDSEGHITCNTRVRLEGEEQFTSRVGG